MRLPSVLFALGAASLGMAYQHGEIPSNIAVRASADGGIDFFHEEDRRSLEADILAKRQLTQAEPESDTYPVQADSASGLKPFIPVGGAGGISKAISRAKRQDGAGGAGADTPAPAVDTTSDEPESDTYPVSNDGSGVKP
ncbi:uncharacterized protein MKK02DRAFT_41118 [Dioszegia hungarica]|uniref:Uncharacterized protein n=1 Tax=Dioszegia hungarica TaxID=4972 RepID=A0AA38LTP5_9TREE|nr:uncharacterized protein MKK02DRAFT_41118 [Dioszegia hungarica]KAI9632806.1 hypothetical protein MKK02DRAFT_41118 [Dioszegia hungarica]